MGKGRMEAFSDGVLAIIITIMVLELRPPHATDLSALRPLTPVLLSYVLSFVYLGIYWNNHHHMLHATRQVTGSVLWANLHLLFWLSLVPFATAWLGENHQAAAPTAIYGVVLIMAAMAYTLLQRQILKAEGPHSVLATAVGRDTKGKLSVLFYALAIGAAFVYPSIADALYVLVALIWLIPDRRIERALAHETPAAQARSGSAAILAILSLSSVTPQYPTPSDLSPGHAHWLYVTEKAGISVYDIDRGHRFVRRIDLPNAGEVKGIGASARLGLLYLSSHATDDLIAIALRGDSVAWRKHLGGYPDSFGVSPDGLLLYVPLRTKGALSVVDAASGEEKDRIMTEHGQPYRDYPYVGAGPHNTWVSPDGSRVYLEILSRPYIYVFDRRLLGKIGPFSKGVRPFTVSADERHVYATIDGLRGFELADLRPDHWGGERVRRVVAHVPPERFRSIQSPPPDKIPHGTPSHGIAISPDQKEVWVVDGVYGYLHVFSLRSATPTQVASIALTDESGGWGHPAWVCFNIDGRFAYTDGGIVVDTRARKIVGRIPASDKLLEVDFVGDSVAAVGRR